MLHGKIHNCTYGMITGVWKEKKEERMKIRLKKQIGKKYIKHWKWFSVGGRPFFPPSNFSEVFKISVNGIYYFYGEN